MTADIDINAEYRRIFGETIRPTLYGKNDSTYLALRQEIIDSKLIRLKSDKFPFEDIADIIIESRETAINKGKMFLADYLVADRKYVMEKLSGIIAGLIRDRRQ